ncbi:MAG: MarR family transcriptional regulator [Streptosporangiaceae bacterium]
MDLTSTAADLLELVTLVVRDAAGEREQLSLTAVAALGSLERSGTQRLTVLAVAEGVSQPSMTQLVHRLEQRGLVRRTSDPADGRVALVGLTAAGARALADRRRRNTERIARLLADLPAADAGALAGALTAVLPALRDRLAGGAGSEES